MCVLMVSGLYGYSLKYVRLLTLVSCLDGEVAEVVETIRLSGIPRSELFIATEVWHDISRPAFDQESLKMALERLDLDYVDLLYLTTRRASLRFSEASLNLFEHRTAEMWNVSKTNESNASVVSEQ